MRLIIRYLLFCIIAFLLLHYKLYFILHYIIYYIVYVFVYYIIYYVIHHMSLYKNALQISPAPSLTQYHELMKCLCSLFYWYQYINPFQNEAISYRTAYLC